MREIGMPFRDDMAEAIRKGLKWQTRRLIEPQPFQDANGDWVYQKDEKSPPLAWPERADIICPWQVGDRIYVREDYKLFSHNEEKGTVKVMYRDGEVREVECYPFFEFRGIGSHLPWTDARHMPKWAARTWLEVTEIRAEKLIQITDEDAVAEGMPEFDRDGNLTTPTEDFADLWDEMYGEGNWNTDPWVFAYTFKEVKEGAE